MPMTRAPKAMMLELLCCLDKRAVYGSLHTQARMPCTLLAASEMPTPVPQISTPPSTSPAATSLATR